MKVEITQAQLSAIIEMAEQECAMLGTSEDDRHRIKWLRLIDRFLDRNGFSKVYKNQ